MPVAYSFVINSANLLEFVKAIGAVSHECVLNVTTAGWEVKVLDRSSVLMAEVSLDRESFVKYPASVSSVSSATGDGVSPRIGIDIERTKEFFQVAKNVDVCVTIDSELRRLTLSTVDGMFSRSQALIAPEYLSSSVPKQSFDFTFPATVKIDGGLLVKGLKSCSLIEEHVWFEVDDDKFVLRTQNDSDIDRFEMVVPASDLLGLKPGKAKSLFSSEYLERMYPLFMGNVVELGIGVDYPLKIAVSRPENPRMNVVMHLAPRIEEN